MPEGVPEGELELELEGVPEGEAKLWKLRKETIDHAKGWLRK